MKKYIVTCILILLVIPVFSQQKEAKDILDKVSYSIQNSGSVRFGFDIDVLDQSQLVGNYQGNINLKGNKFVLETEEVTTWFDGETQWTYNKDNNEVNISNPTEEEIQSINPYALLSIYKNGYSYKLGNTKNFQGNAVTEIQLKSVNDTQDLDALNIYVNSKNYQLVYLEAKLKDGTHNKITIKDYKNGLNYPDKDFIFDKAKYPNIEVIDLR